MPLSLSESIKKLYGLTQIDVQANWRYHLGDLSLDAAIASDFSNWSNVELNTNSYITWSAGRQVLWLGQRFVVPHNLQGYPLAGLALRLILTWWAEDTKIFVNGQLVQEGDLFDSSARVLLSSAVTPGEGIKVVLRLVSPGHDIGGLMRSHCLYESTDSIDPGFIADELTVLQKYLAAFEPKKLDVLIEAVAEINWNTVSDPKKFTRSLSIIRQNLQLKIPTPNSKIHLLGHAHLDMAWLWTVNETWDVAVRTFESVLNLQQEFTDLTYCHTTPALYAWIEQNRPDLFANIKQQIAIGRWEIVGGMWVEPELNLIDGESIVRQILYAQRYTQEKFSQLTQIAWVTDSFGFNWQLPQLLKQGGIEYFVTQKLHWNDTTKFPYGVFWWQSPDGTQILSLMSPPNITGVMDTNPVTMASYAIDWEKQTQINDVFWLPGVGDHGGGPTRDMLEVAKRCQQSPFFPKLKFTTALKYLQSIRNKFNVEIGKNSIPNPIWNDEIYLEFHRGCYTTHADQKRWNRQCERLLYQAELFASLATIITGTTYPKIQLEAAWKKVLLNQFHDILPGTSIPAVFTEANQAWQDAEQVSRELVQASLNAIASQISLPPPPKPDAQPIIVFNPLNWQRSEVVPVSLPAEETGYTPSPHQWEIYDLSGKTVPSQLSDSSTLLFLAKDIPPVGYRLFWLCPYSPNPSVTSVTKSPATETFVLENEFLRIIIEPDTGDLSSIFDKIQQREVLRGAGNQLQGFKDNGQYWDAWNIDPNYTQHPLPPTQLQSIQWVEQGIVRSRLQVVRQLGESQFCQDYILDTESPLLKIVTTVDWQERHVLVKAAFPLNLEANSATYEIPCGAIERSTQPQTAAEKAKWEVPALRWADLGDKTYGVSLLNDCKYGYDAQPSQLRLTLLRSPTWPDPESDQGTHYFTYALYPHDSSWQSAKTVHQGYELNVPLQVLLYPTTETDYLKHLPSVGQFLDLQAENLIVIALKQSEANSNQWILRCYECYGKEAELSLKSDLGLSLTHSVDLLERPATSSQIPQNEQFVKIPPWKIASFALVQGIRDVTQ
ncbi:MULTISPECIES: alpha-mannosidase [unclassified Coleofasciculus]|uniref:alpha-mannosidase n=1 Tax=unclassified Coleofasciculus TaxID=2692782 RepID=UPI00187FD0B3|nr:MULTISPECIES: alpha-mannosidase [unclassified Coleofasciculus]MBE9125465.1 alpha-mannosidase [Coleofasciculus sp. LEGE 07081]MBE9147436.1 alpha-mannosidase [Coleofasciculus sp. LEGE 07092]